MSEDDTDPGLSLGQPLSWPESGLRPHRFAGIFRMLSGEEREHFEDDIDAVGLRKKITVYDGAILDGRNRYLVLVDLGVFEPEDEDWRDRPELFEVFEGSDEEALDYVWSLNEQRRHDSPSQRAASAARYANLRKVTQAEAAEKFGVSERQVNSAAKVIAEGTPELQLALDEGRIPAYLAEQVAELDDDEQREVARQPKGEASAVARQKLQDPPPPAESGPVVKPADPNMIVMFAASVLKVGSMGHSISRAVLDGLAQEHGLLADHDGTFNLARPVTLAFEMARQKLKWSEDQWAGRAPMIMGAAGLPEDHDGLVQAYRNAIVLYDRAVKARDRVKEAEYSVAMEAILYKARLLNPTDGSREIEAAVRAPDGVVPMWGQQGCFIAEGATWQRDEPIRAIVVLGRFNSVYAVDPGKPFPSETGFMSLTWEHHDGTVEGLGRELIGAAIRTFHNSLNNGGKPMPVPSTVYRLNEGGMTGPVAVSMEGLELDQTAYRRALDNLSEPKGRLHQSSAADAIRAGVAAGISRAQMAEDLGHPIGTVQTWTARLGLTDGSRKGSAA